MTKEKIQKIVKQEVELYDFSDAFDYDRVALNISNRLEKLVIPKTADRKLTAYVKDNVITLQAADYVEDGNLIKINGNKIELYEIPYGGGEEIFIGEFATIIDAIAKGDMLT